MVGHHGDILLYECDSQLGYYEGHEGWRYLLCRKPARQHAQNTALRDLPTFRDSLRGRHWAA